MSPGKICCSYNSSQIVRIFNTVQKNKKRIFVLLLCPGKQIFYLCIFIGRGHCDHTLVMFLGKLIQTFFFYKIQNCVCFFCLPDDRPDRTVLASVQNIDLIDGLSRSQCLQHRISSRQQIFFVTHSFSPTSNPILISSKARAVLPDKYRYPIRASTPVAIRYSTIEAFFAAVADLAFRPRL